MTFSHYEEYLAQLQYYPSEDGKMAYLDLGNIHIIKGKHFIQEEQPELISQIILDILTKEPGQER